MARLDQAITNIVDIFIEYTDEDVKKRQLSKVELKNLLDKEIQSPELKVRHSTRRLYTTHTAIHKTGVLS